MSKTAVFVEGKAELIFIREFLLKMCDLDKLGIACYELRSESMKKVPFHYPEDTEKRNSADDFYMIVNVGGDTKVLSTIKKRLTDLYNAGFEKIIGIRDMYCDDYHHSCGKSREINPEINKRFIEGTQTTISKLENPDKIKFFFATMEIEAWFLGIPTLFINIDPTLTIERILEETGIDLNKDPETTIYHPAKELGIILELTGKTYKKHESEIERISSKIQYDDYEALFSDETKCSTFTEMVISLLHK